MSECGKSANGEHEMDFERMVYSRHVGSHAAVFKVECLHCKADGELTVDALDAEWETGENYVGA